MQSRRKAKATITISILFAAGGVALGAYLATRNPTPAWWGIPAWAYWFWSTFLGLDHLRRRYVLGGTPTVGGVTPSWVRRHYDPWVPTMNLKLNTFPKPGTHDAGGPPLFGPIFLLGLAMVLGPLGLGIYRFIQLVRILR